MSTPFREATQALLIAIDRDTRAAVDDFERRTGCRPESIVLTVPPEPGVRCEITVNFGSSVFAVQPANGGRSS